MKKLMAISILAIVLLMSAACTREEAKNSHHPQSSQVTTPQQVTPSATVEESTPTPTPTITKEPATAEPVTMYVYGADSLNVRQQPSTDSEVLGKIEEMDQVQVSEKNVTDGWHKVSYNDKVGYCSAKYLQENTAELRKNAADKLLKKIKDDIAQYVNDQENNATYKKFTAQVETYLSHPLTKDSIEELKNDFIVYEKKEFTVDGDKYSIQAVVLDGVQHQLGYLGSSGFVQIHKNNEIFCAQTIIDQEYRFSGVNALVNQKDGKLYFLFCTYKKIGIIHSSNILAFKWNETEKALEPCAVTADQSTEYEISVVDKTLSISTNEDDYAQLAKSGDNMVAQIAGTEIVLNVQ